MRKKTQPHSDATMEKAREYYSLFQQHLHHLKLKSIPAGLLQLTVIYRWSCNCVAAEF